ncbi:unnamed protein product [Closterium sp. NIES-53]
MRQPIPRTSPTPQPSQQMEQPKVLPQLNQLVPALPVQLPSNEDNLYTQIQQVLLAALMDETPFPPPAECSDVAGASTRVAATSTRAAARRMGVAATSMGVAATCMGVAATNTHVAATTTGGPATGMPVAAASKVLSGGDTTAVGDAERSLLHETPQTTASKSGSDRSDRGALGNVGRRLLRETPQTTTSKSGSDGGDVGAAGSSGRRSLHPRAARDRERRRQMAESLQSLRAILPAGVLGGQQDFGSIISAAAQYIRSLEARVRELDANATNQNTPPHGH